MNRIVREHYPVSKLPEDLREGFEGQADVRVTIDAVVPETEAAQSLPSLPLSYFKQFRRPRFTSIEEINDHVRSLRDEWSDRER